MFGHISDQKWAWLSRGHRWAPGVRNPLKSSVTGPSMLVNCYLQIKFHKKIKVIINLELDSCWYILRTAGTCDTVTTFRFSIQKQFNTNRRKIMHLTSIEVIAVILAFKVILKPTSRLHMYTLKS